MAGVLDSARYRRFAWELGVSVTSVQALVPKSRDDMVQSAATPR
jgi:hypothetical protein